MLHTQVWKCYNTQNETHGTCVKDAICPVEQGGRERIGHMKATQREFLDFAAQILGVPRESVSVDTAHGAIPEWDSVMHLRLVMEIQDRFGIDIPIERVPDLRTLGDFFSLL